jgi:AraC-like DNA-binding protein
MKLFLKYDFNAVCKAILEEQLNKTKLPYSILNSGEVEILNSPTEADVKLLHGQLKKYGIEIIETPKSILVQKTKDAIVEMVYQKENLPASKISSYLSGQLHHSYGYLSRLFSEVTYTSIENYIILQKIEYAKQLILMNNLTFTEIAWKLNYSSVAHFSTQFKNVTGLTPSAFKQIISKRQNKDHTKED